MSGFLEGLVRRGAGLGAAPGMQTAALRPLSRFERHPFEAAGAEPAAPAEPDGLAPVPWRDPDRDPGPARGRAGMAHPPDEDERPSPEPVPTRGPRPAADVGPIGPRQAGAHEQTPPIESGSSATHHGVAADARATTQPPAAGPWDGPPLPSVPLPESHSPQAAIQGRHLDALAPAERADAGPATAPLESHPPQAPIRGRHGDEPTKRPDGEPAAPSPRSHPPRAAIRGRHGDAPAEPADGEPATSSPQRDPIWPEGHDGPATPQLTISVGRIEIDFGPRPAAPPAPAGPQRTRGFEAYARARRGHLR
ncbi:MAG TPA: hypothetical protein VF601_23480 [Beijerinckiaceae bacterium]|jgi:hypothetical protein